MTTVKFFICESCGNIAYQVAEGGGRMVCCGMPMAELVPNSTDASVEKHKPVAAIEGDTLKVTVGEAAHPMAAEHSIRWVAVIAGDTVTFKYLAAEGEPQATFEIAGATPEKVLAYCNKHGLWETEI